MSNAKPQHELVGTLINKYPHLALRRAETAGVPCPAHERAVAGPNTHQVRKAGQRGQVLTDATVHLLRGDRAQHFFQVEMQGEYRWSKLATLRAYHGSEVRNTRCGGHIFVLSPDPAAIRSFRRAEASASAQLAFSVSYHSGPDLQPLAAAGRPFADRALAAALTDFTRGVTATTLPMLVEMTGHDETIADLFFTAILDMCPDAGLRELEATMTEAALDRLNTLPSFQRWAARASEKLVAQARAETDQARAETAQARAETAQATDQARVQAFVRSLLDYFTARNDVPTPGALAAIDACTSPSIAQHWLRRAYAGETSAQIFPEPPAEA